MNPQNFNNKLSEIYNSLDGKDLSEARMRKEDVWAKVKTKDKEKSKKPILLLLLLGGAALLAYLLFGNNKVNNEKPLPKIEKVDSSKNLLAHSQEQVKLNQRLLFEKGQSLDSLNIIHKELESNYKKLLQEIALKEQTLISQSVIKDTIYVKEIKTQEMVVEKYASNAIRKKEELSFEEWASRLNTLLLHLGHLFSPSKIVLGGGVSKHFDEYKENFKGLDFPVRPASLFNHTGLIGAAFYASQKGL